MRTTVGTPGLERVPSFSAREQVAYVHILWGGFPLRCWALFCSWSELDKLKALMGPRYW